ncbi:hypothetical protein LCGC14_2396660 [marine sediment metagenome]|uniref:Uncharacterized protein n=1 Tax=marine sediment metagenome TaxID=412755 RepID=A0A0F9CIP1_9ZZZZ
MSLINPDSELMARSDVVLIVSPDGPVIIVKDRHGGTTVNGQLTKDGRVYVYILEGEPYVVPPSK